MLEFEGKGPLRVPSSGTGLQSQVSWEQIVRNATDLTLEYQPLRMWVRNSYVAGIRGSAFHLELFPFRAGGTC